MTGQERAGGMFRHIPKAAVGQMGYIHQDMQVFQLLQKLQALFLQSQVRTYSELEANEKAGKMSALLSLEEGAIFQNSLDSLRWFHRQGVRMATLTWNYENDFGFPNCMGDPLTQKTWSWGDDRGLM